MRNTFVALASLTALVTDAGAASLIRATVVNHDQSPIVSLYATDTDDWQKDLLGRYGTVSSGGSLRVDFGSGACVRDLRAVFFDGRDAISHGVDVCANDRITFD